MSGFSNRFLIELLVVISIIAFLVSTLLIVVTRVRAESRDEVRLANISTLRKALQLYAGESGSGFPTSLSGECLSATAGAGLTLIASKALVASNFPTDPMWKSNAPAHVPPTQGVDSNYCYYYHADDSAGYQLYYFTETNSNIPAVLKGVNSLIVSKE